MRPVTYLCAALALACGACTTPLVVDEHGRPLGFARSQGSPDGSAGPGAASAAGTDPARGGERTDPASGARGDETPLLGWNGSVVQGATPTQEAPSHGIEPGQGRMRIIELYQQVLDERDALRDELEAMASAMEAAQRHRIELEEENRTLRERVVAIENAQASMQAENLDLAARLTTAQIRRLEAEKLLLETKIEELRTRPSEASAGERVEPGEAGS